MMTSIKTLPNVDYFYKFTTLHDFAYKSPVYCDSVIMANLYTHRSMNVLLRWLNFIQTI